MSRLTDLIAQAKAKDLQLGADLESEFRVLSERRPFGLNFERHQPEAVELPSRPVRKGDKVRVLPPRGTTAKGEPSLWRVTGFVGAAEARIVRLTPVTREGPDGVTERFASVADLVVVAEFRDPIYPGLLSTGRLERGTPDQPFHTVINAENYHALQTLLFTHRGQVDCIYIDPPYATGKDDWIYNDRHVDADDMYRHSKWLAFMERRLKLAAELLKDTGVIIVAIGDDQHHRLRLLMDQVFHESNFIMNVCWQGGVSALAKHHGGGLDYMLIYGRDASKVPPFRDPKPRAPEMLALVRDAMDGGATAEEAQGQLRRFIKKYNDLPPGVARFNKVDAEGNIYLEGDLANSLYRPNLRYPITDPATGRVYSPPKNGWAVGQDLMNELLAGGRVVFHGGEVPARKRLLIEQMTSLPSPSFYRDRRTGTNKLKEVLGEARFPNPKDYTVLMRWIGMVTPPDGVVLDFFGGSGSTLEAVARLNAEDNGTRECILVTNNELGSKQTQAMQAAGWRKGDPEWEARGVYEYVARPRIRTVVTGERPDGTLYDDTVPANVEFFNLTYKSLWRVARHRAFDAVAPLLWLRAGATGRRIDAIPEQGWDVADKYGVLVNLDRARAFAKEVAATDTVGLVYVVTDDDRRFQMVCAELPESVEVVRLYEAYLRNFEINTTRD